MNYKKNKYKSFFCLFLIITLLTGVVNMGLLKTMAYESILSDDAFYINAIDKSISEEHMLILQEDTNGNSKLYVQGKNDCGELGILSYDYREHPTEVTHFVPDNIERVWAIKDASFILTSDNKLYASGLNTSNRLGFVLDNGNNTNMFKEVDLPSALVGKIDEIYASSTHTIITSTDGKVYGCGSNNNGQLGLPNTTTALNSFTEIEDMSNHYSAIAVNENYTVCVDENSDVYFTGLTNSYIFDHNIESCYGLKKVYTVNNDEFVEKIERMNLDIPSNPTFKIYASPYGFAVTEGFKVGTEYFTSRGLNENEYELNIGDTIFPIVIYFKNLETCLNLEDYADPKSPVFEKYTKQNEIFCYTIEMPFGFSHKEIYKEFKTAIFEKGFVVYGTLVKQEDVEYSVLSYFGKGLSDGYTDLKWLQDNDEFKSFSLLDDMDTMLVINDAQFNKNNVLITAQNLDDSKLGVFLFGKHFEKDPSGNEVIKPMGTGVSSLEIQADDIDHISVPEYKEYVGIKDFDTLTFTKGELTTVNFNEIERKGLKLKSTSDVVFVVTDETINSAKIFGESVGTAELMIVDFLNLDSNGREKILHTYTIDVQDVKPVYDVKFEMDSYTLEKGESKYLYVSGLDGLDFELRSGNNSIVSIADSLSKLIKAEDIGTTELSIWVNDEVVAVTNVTVTEPVATEVTIEATDIEIKMGETKTVRPVVTPSEEAALISFSSSNEVVCSINEQTGLLTPNLVGTATITISHPSGAKKDIQVTVNPADYVEPNKVVINVNNKELSLLKGSTSMLEITTTPSHEIENITITSNNPEICTVDANGKITAIENGTTNIVISHEDAEPVVVSVVVYSNVSISCDSSIELEKGSSKAIIVSVSPESEKSNISYTSSNNNICSVSNTGVVLAKETGSAVITVKHISGISKQVNVTVKPTQSTKPEENKDPKIVLKNQLNENEELDISLGGKVTLSLSVENSKPKAKFKIDIMSGNKYINIDNEKLTVEGLKVGTARIKITNTADSAMPPLYLTIRVEKAEYSDSDKINIKLQEIKDKEEEEKKKENRIKLEVGSKYQITVSGVIDKIDLTTCFDDYFTVKTDEKYVSYLGNGVLRGNYPGETEVKVYNISGDKLFGIVYVTIPYPNEFFVEMPEAIGIPQNRTIQVKFNNNISPSSVTQSSVFLQKNNSGNSNNIQRIAYVTGNTLNIKITDEKFDWSSAYLFITPDVKDTSFVGTTYPIKIKISFQ